jgi:branched-chain amino acid transport system substrate-binding protein
MGVDMTRTFAIIAAVLVAVLTVVSSQPLRTKVAEVLSLSNTDRNIVAVGALLCLTGTCAEWGNESLKGAELAIEELNNQGGLLGKRLKLIAQDSREENPSEAVSGFLKLKNHPNMHYIVGPTWTPAGLAIAPIASKQKNLIVTSPSLGVKEFNEAAPNLFNTWPHDEVSSRKLARFALAQGWKRAAIFSAQQPWTQAQSDAFADEMIKNGGLISKRVDPLETERNLKM